MIFRNAKRFEVRHYCPVQATFGIKATACKCINADMGIKLGLFSRWWTCEAVRFMYKKPNILIAWFYLECILQGHVDRLD